ncbi:MAG: Crp/Fnr family transcriptional regulator [Pedobacter sp.]|nr:MAG: Crp/Fnr family transcriptional regulator [Pedobacter sp.]
MREIPEGCGVDHCYLCSRCVKDWLPAIAQQRKTYQLKKGQSVFREGEAVEGIYFVYSGVIKVHKRWDREKEIITRFALLGDIIGHLGLGKNPVYPVSATALSTATVCFVGLDFFNSSLRVNPGLTIDLMQFFANELQESQKMMRNMAHMSVRARIANTFLMLKKQFGLDRKGFIDIDLSRQDMASYSGTTYETLFKVINEFSASGKIETFEKRIFISDEPYLQSLVKLDPLKS